MSNDLHPRVAFTHEVDEFAIVCTDPSVLVRVNFGSATVGQVVGFNWQLGANRYQTRYTIIVGDTPSTIAQKVDAALHADATLHSYLAAVGMLLTAGAEANFVEFDSPVGMNPTPFGPGVTVTTHGIDNNPLCKLCRYVPGYQFKTGDEIAKITWEMNSNPTSGINMTAGAVTMFITGVIAGYPTTKMAISTVTDKSKDNALPAMYFSADNGCRMSDNEGHGNDVIRPPGAGNFGTHALYLRPHTPASTLRDGALWVDENGNLKFRKNGQTRTLV